MGQSDAGSEIVWLRGLLEDLGVTPNGPTTLYADNQGAIRLANNPENHRRTKHIAVRYHYTRELIENSTLKLVYKETGYASGLPHKTTRTNEIRTGPTPHGAISDREIVGATSGRLRAVTNA